MKSAIFAVLLLTAAFALAIPAGAQSKSKDDLYKDIVKLSNSQDTADRDKAFDLSKELLSKWGKDKDERITKVRTFYEKYREGRFLNAVDSAKYPQAFELGKEILAEQPSNTFILLNLTYAGYNASNKGDRTYEAETAANAAKTIELIEKGTVPSLWEPFKGQDEATAFMYFINGKLIFEKDPKIAVGKIYKSTQFDSPLKTSSSPYYLIAYYYEDLYQRSASELKAKIDAKSISESDRNAASERVDKIIDLMLDAYARVYKRGEAENNPDKEKWKVRLAQIYKFRKGIDVGLTEFVNMVNTMPMPDPSAM